jgi:hypothetical protein
MKRKLKAIWRILFCDGYILCVIKKNKPQAPFYDHTVCEDDVIYYSGFLVNHYANQKVEQEYLLDQAKQILGI